MIRLKDKTKKIKRCINGLENRKIGREKNRATNI